MLNVRFVGGNGKRSLSHPLLLYAIISLTAGATASKVQNNYNYMSKTPNWLTQWHQKHFKLAPRFHSFPCQTLQNCVTGSAHRGGWGKCVRGGQGCPADKVPPTKAKRKKNNFSADIASGQLTHLEKHWRMETVSLCFRSLWAWFFYIRGLPNVTHRSLVLIQTDIWPFFSITSQRSTVYCKLKKYFFTAQEIDTQDAADGLTVTDNVPKVRYLKPLK